MKIMYSLYYYSKTSIQSCINLVYVQPSQHDERLNTSIDILRILLFWKFFM